MNCWSSSPTIKNCVLTQNLPGGILTNNASPLIINCTFDANTGSGVDCLYGGSPTIIGCTFTGSESSGVYCYDTSPTIVNCLIFENVGTYGGGGIYFDYSNATVVNCTIVNNSAVSGGGGIHCYNSNPTLTNCIVRGNTPDEVFGGNPPITYSNVMGGYAGAGNIDADPYFVNPDESDYRIGPGSPCIDAGNNGAVPSGIDTDLDGNPRFIDDPFTDDTGLGDPPIVDMGANEYQADATGMMVLPAFGFYSDGPNGGPFTPDSITYTLQNYDAIPLEFSVGKTAQWLELSSDGGVIPAGGEVEVVASITAYANGLANGEYQDTVQFTNETNHDGDTTRLATLVVGVPIPMVVFDFDMEPGWYAEGEWGFGQPLGQGGYNFGNPDPTSGYTGDNVYGYNLEGDYSVDVGGPYYLTTGAIDCSDLTHVELHFYRWLNSDYQPYVYQTIEVSSDRAGWTLIWENGSSEIAENAWSAQEYDISAVADLQPTVYIRWGHEVASAGAWAYSGWNIDDVQIWGVEQGMPCPWDVNDDEDVNIDDLFEVLGHWGEGAGPYDVNFDGIVDIDDVFAILGNWGPCP
ncbi:MAG: right-handed parallel beta-helix repeat-containing protein [Phycisphaerales bacterium]|nr:MAG: right-handed parallel beta-helix repeat-containing protein [Phycisphaerales bacterium]